MISGGIHYMTENKNNNIEYNEDQIQVLEGLGGQEKAEHI